MNAEQFVKAHRGDWHRLNELVQKTQQSRLNSLSDEELHELGTLYRRAAADLARVQTRYASTSAGRELVRSLNDLVLRAHTQVYAAPAPQPMGGVNFVLYGFPATVRRQWRVIAVSAFLMFGPALLAHLAVLFNPDLAPLFVPDSAIREVQHRAQKKIITGWGGNNEFQGLLSSPAISSFIMTNNILVTLKAIAMGVTMGLGTALVLIFNGLMLGGLSGVAMNEHVDLLFWAVILPHGILELSAITIAGGAGLVLARALYAPGDLPRRDAIKIAGGEAARLAVGVAGILVIAGLIEGFITPQPIPPLLKIAFALLTAIGLILYLNLRPRPTVVG
ncbi:MAG: stage II sporulation protein M [Abitibacteriaceae bacterium]|nr:stage II sporulation protein M [Abditibacteriaceae bacterium]